MGGERNRAELRARLEREQNRHLVAAAAALALALCQPVHAQLNPSEMSATLSVAPLVLSVGAVWWVINTMVTGPIVIEDHVWIAAECFVHPDVVIREGAVIGARSVVLKEMPAWSICAGHPCRKIKDRVLKDRHV